MTFFRLEIFAHLERMAEWVVGGGRRAARHALNEPFDPDSRLSDDSESEGEEEEEEEEEPLTKEQYCLIRDFKVEQGQGRVDWWIKTKTFTLADGTEWTARHLDQYTLPGPFPPYLLLRRTTKDGHFKACHAPNDPEATLSAIRMFIFSKPGRATMTSLEEFFQGNVTGIHWEEFKEEHEEEIGAYLSLAQTLAGGREGVAMYNFRVAAEFQDEVGAHRFNLLENLNDNEDD